MVQSPILVVFIENAGRVAGVDLPRWASQLLDWTTEEYGKLAVRVAGPPPLPRHRGAGGRTGHGKPVAACAGGTDDAVVDVLMLVHGQAGYACGCGEHRVGADFFEALRQLRRPGWRAFRLRAVYQMNCYGQTLGEEWLSVGAQAVNGTVGINWLPEPSLSIFLNGWLGGQPFGDSVRRSNRIASPALGQVWRSQGSPHPKIASSQMVVFGESGLTIHIPTATTS